LKRKIITTADGSKTIYLEDWNEQYHSKHGAINEAYHVFIKNGLEQFGSQAISIMEVGFGTGLNALITLKEAPALKLKVHYTGVEAFPISMEETAALNYSQLLNIPQLQQDFMDMHTAAWNKMVALSKTFTLIKRKMEFKDIKDYMLFNLIYFDAFGARVQPELWTVRIFEKMFHALKPKGILVTYSAKGSVRRAMQEVGFVVERLPGPPGKREMLRARKP